MTPLHLRLLRLSLKNSWPLKNDEADPQKKSLTAYNVNIFLAEELKYYENWRKL
jgi:hypothetical protein